MTDDRRRAVLFTVGDALTVSGANWWITDGTLLGFIRERDFIPHDTDMDIGVEAATIDRNSYAALADAGMGLGRAYGAPGCDFLSCGTGDIYVDLFRFYPLQGGGMYHSCYVGFNRDDAERVDYHYPRFDGRTRVADWWGRPVRIPADPTDYLATKYGPDWRTPKLGSDWEHIKDPRNFHLPSPRQRHPWHSGDGRPDLLRAMGDH